MADTKEEILGVGDAAKQTTADLNTLTSSAKLTTEELQEVAGSAENAAAELNTLSGVTGASQRALNNLNGVTASVNSLFSSFDNALQRASISLNTTKSLTDQQTTQFSLLSNSVFGARESYVALAGTDFSGFKNQLNDLMQVAKDSPLSIAGKKAKEAMGEMVSSLSGRAASEIAKMSTETLAKLASSLVTSADNALKLQSGFLGLQGKAGGLNSVFSLAGTNLENINTLIGTQADMMTNAQTATHASAEQVEKYYMALGAVPGALNAVVTSTQNADNRVTMLTAAMKVASGTGRDFTDIVDDLKIAFRNYGMTGEGALRFSAQISEVTQNLGVELDVVKNALRSGSEAFKMFSHTGTGASQMATGLADIMNHYGKALESTGLQGTQAVDVIGNMTQQMGKMSIAQKSFLSQQTGGSGGLMGAFQIDKMLRDGDVKGVFEKVRQQMKQQFGKIVTVDEAAQSEGAANQMTRQMTMLKQGPLGQFARSDQEAQSILEGFRAADEGKGGKEINEDILKTTIDRGNSVQEKSYSVMSESNAHLAAIRRKADIGTLSFLQKSGVTAGQGIETSTGEMLQNKSARDAQAGLRQSMSGATNMGTEQFIGSYADIKEKNTLINATGKNIVSSLAGLKDSFRILPLSIKGITEGLSQAISSGNVDEAQDRIKELEDSIQKTKATTDDVATLAQTDRHQAVINKAKAWATAASETLGTEVTSTGANLGAAANRSVGAASRGATGSNTTESGNVTNAPGAQKQSLTFHHHITGFCLKCKQEIESGHQAKGVAPQAY